MFTLAFVSSKGGSGKSTLAANVTAAAVQAGLNVAVVDCDPQRTLANWCRRRAVTCHAIEPQHLVEQLTAIRDFGVTDLTVIDTAGVAGRGAMLAARAADLTLVPVQPTQADYDAVQATAAALNEAARPYAFVVNRAASLDRARDAARSLVKVGMVVPVWTASRVVYDDAVAEGRGVTEVEPRGRAAEEITALWRWVVERMQKGI